MIKSTIVALLATLSIQSKVYLNAFERAQMQTGGPKKKEQDIYSTEGMIEYYYGTEGGNVNGYPGLEAMRIYVLMDEYTF